MRQEEEHSVARFAWKVGRALCRRGVKEEEVEKEEEDGEFRTQHHRPAGSHRLKGLTLRLEWLEAATG